MAKKNAKNAVISYDLASVQVTKDLREMRLIQVEEETYLPGHCMLLTTSESSYRSVYFGSSIELNWCYLNILKRQGVPKELGKSQYMAQESPAQGRYGKITFA